MEPISANSAALELSDRPRDRLFERGPQALTECELLAVILSSGQLGEEDGHGLASRVLSEFRGLARLSEASPLRLGRVPGMGPASAGRLAASFELSRQLSAVSADDPVPIAGPNDAARLLIPLLRPQRKEVFVVLCLDTRGRARAIRTVSTGSLSASIVHPRELFGEAILESAASVIIAHNHPSGDPTPSAEDLAVTRKLVEAGEILGIPVLDHVVVGADRVHSILEGTAGATAMKAQGGLTFGR